MKNTKLKYNFWYISLVQSNGTILCDFKLTIFMSTFAVYNCAHIVISITVFPMPRKVRKFSKISYFFLTRNFLWLTIFCSLAFFLGFIQLQLSKINKEIKMQRLKYCDIFKYSRINFSKIHLFYFSFNSLTFKITLLKFKKQFFK